MQYLEVELERQQKNPGVERIHEVRVLDENGESVRTIPELAYKEEFFDETMSELEADILSSLKKSLQRDDIVIEIVEG